MQLRVSQATFLCWQDTVPTTQNKSQGLWELHNPLTTGWKSCWLLYPSKVKANNKPSWHFFPCLLLWLLHSTQRKTLGDISQWSVDDMTIYLWFFFFSLQVNTGFIQEKKKKNYRLDKGLEAGWQAPWWSHWVTKMVPHSLNVNIIASYPHSHLFGDLYFFFVEAMMLVAISRHFIPQTAFTSFLHHL